MARNPVRAAAVLIALASVLAGSPGRTQGATATPGKPPIVFADELSEHDRTLLEPTARMVARWAMVQRVVAAVVAQNADPAPAERVAEIDQEWQTGASVGGLAERVLSNDCAQALQSVVAANPGIGGAFVTDRQGALVCATQRPARYHHGAEEPWSRAFADGAGAIFVGAPADDPGSDLRVQPIAVPVRSAGQTVGVLTVTRLADG